MGFGSFIKKTASSLEDKAKVVIRKPLSEEAIQHVGSLFTGIPLNFVSKEFSKDGSGYSQQKRVVSQAKHDKAIKQGVWDLKQPLTKEGRQTMAVYGGYIVITAAVVVVCVVSFAALCGPAIGLGITAATTVAGMDSSYRAEKKAEEEAKRLAAIDSDPGRFPINQQIGGAGSASSELLNGDFSGLFSSLDPNTAAGMKTIVFLGAVGGVVAMSYFGMKYLRK